MVIEIEADAILRIPDLRGCRITCLEGALWITHDGHGRDIVLSPGMTHEVTRKAGIVQAVRASRIALADFGGIERFVYRAVGPRSRTAETR